MAIYKKGTTKAQKAKSIIIIIVMVVLFSIPIYKIGKKLLSYTTSKEEINLVCPGKNVDKTYTVTLNEKDKLFKIDDDEVDELIQWDKRKIIGRNESRAFDTNKSVMAMNITLDRRSGQLEMNGFWGHDNSITQWIANCDISGKAKF